MYTKDICHSSALIFADCHLPQESSNLPKHKLALATFYEFVNEIDKSSCIEAVFILGDLFEYWIGDDDGLQQYPKVINLLGSLSNSGKKVYFQVGNRDFLVGREFFKKTKVTLLPETQLARLGDFSVYLSHGDELCTLDEEYQEAKKITRDPQWIKNILSLPIAERQKLALEFRKSSIERQKGLEDSRITDVYENSFLEVLAANPEVDYFIHGHTHKSRVHNYSNAQRWVVGDWYDGVGNCIYIKDSDISFTKKVPI